ncbi:MAG: putative glycoside hydrolase, partial [Clostridia bacterium]
AFSKVTAKKLAPVAAISCFRDNRAPRREQTLACRTKNKVIWLDSNNITWLNPFVPKARTYITTLISELYDIGFREVMLSNVSFPVVGKTSILHYPDEASATKQSAISTFLGEVKALAASKNGLHISAVFDDRTKKGETLPGGQALADFTSAFYRVYAPADGADSAIFAKINAIITDKNVLNRFVPIIKTDDTGDGLAAAITAVRTGGRGVLLWSADGDYTAALSK